MAFRNIRPLHIMWQEGLEGEILAGYFAGINRTLLLAGVAQEFKLEYLGQRRQPDYLNPDGTLLNSYQSLDWHIEWARQKSTINGHLNSAILLDSLKNSPTYTTEPRYELVLVKEPIHSGNHSNIYGVGEYEHGAVITLNPHLHFLRPTDRESLRDKEERHCNFWNSVQLNTMHEIGHVFGLCRGTGIADATDEDRKQSHCLNDCVMYWRETYELDKKIKQKPFCDSCLEQLKQHFIVP